MVALVRLSDNDYTIFCSFCLISISEFYVLYIYSYT